MSCLVKKLKVFNVNHVLPSQEQFKEHIKRNFIKIGLESLSDRGWNRKLIFSIKSKRNSL